MYTVIQWPDIQEYLSLEGFQENSYLINDIDNFGSSAYFVNTEWLHKVSKTNLELRKTKSIVDNNEYYEIVSWYPNDLYGKEHEFIKLPDGRYKHPEWNFYCTKTSFEKEKLCYTICYFNKYKDDIELCMVGDRLLNNDVNWDVLRELIKEGFEKSRKLYDL